jgi:hypothetical protein
MRRQLLFRFTHHSVCLSRLTPKALQVSMSNLVLREGLPYLLRPQRVGAQAPDYLFSLETKVEF